MANKITKAQVLKSTKDNIVADETFIAMLENLGAVQVGDYDYAIPTMVGDLERWAKVSITAKDTITDDEGEKVAYTPEIEIERWEFDKADKAERKAERERKHQETLRKAEERKAKAKAKALAKKGE